LGWGPYQADHEDANAQFEINWDFDDAMLTADRHTFFKFMLRSVAEKYGVRATMMPKPFADRAGNGCHLHITLHDTETGKNVFKDKESSDEYQLSGMAHTFLGGLIEHAGGLTALGAPTVNSYKRLGSASQSMSGATWAPSVASHGGNDRTHVIRVPDFPRFELRLGDMAASPYIYPAAVLAAGLDGVAKQSSPGPRAKVAASELPAGSVQPLPENLLDAVRALENDTALTEALGPKLVGGFCKLRRQQWSEYSHTLSQWEMDAYVDV
jgi:glutamine synthetase